MQIPLLWDQKDPIIRFHATLECVILLFCSPDAVDLYQFYASWPRSQFVWLYHLNNTLLLAVAYENILSASHLQNTAWLWTTCCKGQVGACHAASEFCLHGTSFETM